MNVGRSGTDEGLPRSKEGCRHVGGLLEVQTKRKREGLRFYSNFGTLKIGKNSKGTEMSLLKEAGSGAAGEKTVSKIKKITVTVETALLRI